MVEKEIQFRKKREIGEIITDSFDFLKFEIKTISRLFLIYVLPFIIVYGVLQVYVQMKFMGTIDFNDPESLLSNIGPVYMNIFIVSLFGIFVQSLLAGTYYTYIEFYVKKGKGNFEINEITTHFFSNSLLALGANLVLFIIVTIGVIMCILPGLYLANTLSIVVMIFIFEKKGLSHAFTRSFYMVNSQWWNTLLINILGIVLIWVVGFIISIPTMLTGIGTSLFSIQKTGTIEYPDWYWILMGFSTIVSAILWIVPYTFLAFQYFNLDERTKPVPPSVQNSTE